MNRLVLFLFFCAVLLPAADLAEVHAVYLLKMSHGMDQYLANRLTNEHIFQVVTDPKLADSILTDHIGDAFQSQMEELFPPEPAQAAAPPEKEPDTRAGGLLATPMNKLASPASNSSFGRATGTIFIVNAKSRQVVWSAYETPKDSSSRQLDRTASDIVSRIKRDLKKK